MIGGGGGSTGGCNTGTAPFSGPGIIGADSVFGSPEILRARGGGNGVWNTTPLAGGTATIGAGAFGITIQGASGSGSLQTTGNTNPTNGGAGAVSPFGGNGSQSYVGPGFPGIPNTGSGASGGGTGATGTGNNVSGGGGGAGGYLEATIVLPFPGANFPFVVGDGGAAGTPGTVGAQPGAKGGSGCILISEIYWS